METCPTVPPHRGPRAAWVCQRLGCTGRRAEPRHIPPDTGVGRGGTAHPTKEQSPPPSQSVGLQTPVLPNPTLARRDSGDGSSHSHPTSPPQGGRFAPSAAAAAGLSRAPSGHREQGRREGSGAGAFSRKPRTSWVEPVQRHPRLTRDGCQVPRSPSILHQPLGPSSYCTSSGKSPSMGMWEKSLERDVVFTQTPTL